MSLISMVAGGYMKPVLICAFGSLLLGSVGLGYLYKKEVEHTGALVLSLETATSKANGLKETLKGERQSTRRLSEADGIIDETFDYINEEVNDAEGDENGDISDSAVAAILCKNGLATDSACKRAIADGLIE